MDFAALREKAKGLSKTLNESTDELNAQLKEAEKVLMELKLGVSVSVDMSMDMVWGETLDFGKIEGEWKLLHWSGPVEQAVFRGNEDDGNVPLRGPSWRSIPLLSASRAVRVRACEHLASLFASLIQEAERQIGEVKEGAQMARTFVKSVRGELEAQPAPHIAAFKAGAGATGISHNTHLVNSDGAIVRRIRTPVDPSKPRGGKGGE
jgi:hypothetical protein